MISRWKYSICGLTLAILMIACYVIRAYPSAKLTVLPSDIIFSHAFHVGEQEVDCESCHTEISSSENANEHNLPTMDECAACHDIEDDEACGMCHKNAEEPSGFEIPARTVHFSHASHLRKSIPCDKCHATIPASEHSAVENLPTMSICMDCHNGNKADNGCELCHGVQISLSDIHPEGWKNNHGEQAALDLQYCTGCHRSDNGCLDCHRGDNLTGQIHDLNFEFTHGLEARGKIIDCSRCHENRQFCVSCHDNQIRMPLLHSTLSWRTDHGRAARRDSENCAACHDDGDPTCARSGCHSDFDGLRGTDNRIHDPSSGRFDIHGAWHSDRSYFCYQCHTYTGSPGDGFCGYCHGSKHE